MTQDAFYITTPIYYCNDAPHVGHAYTTIACDLLARFHRLDGKQVKFLTGTDEHGQKVQQAAEKQGVSPQELVDSVSPRFEALSDAFNLTNDDFIRTTQPRHYAAAQALWARLVEKGAITLGAYEGWYSVRDEAYYAEGELTDGPDGEKIAPSGAPVEWVEEPSYFFNLSQWQQPLLDYYNANPDFVAPKSRRNEVVSFVEGGLKDLSVSRTAISWGVPVPGAPEHVMYVWIDALTNYLTAIGYPDEDAGEYKTFWPASHHIIGKDIIRFHAVYWPAFLMAAELPLPKRIFAHGWIMNGGEKMSKSLGNVIDPFNLIDTYGLDQTRYFLMREVSFGQDGVFSHEAMVKRMNGDLANDLGNLAQRSLSMIAKNCDNQVPQPAAFSDEDKAMIALADGLLEKVRAQFDEQAIHLGLATIWELVSEANRYFAGQEPWALRKTDPERMGTVLYVTAELIRQIAILAQPVVPESAAKLLDQLSVAEDARTFAQLGEGGRIAPGAVVEKPQGIFPRFVDEDDKK
ncbi:MAG: methionine--tRNA ligase [Alphaproteobacteria bacterium]